jgi:hypothetical protein
MKPPKGPLGLPIVTGDPAPDPDGPDPVRTGTRFGGLSTLVTGLLCGAGGAASWLVLGPALGGDSLLEPVVTGFLGGTTTRWVANSVRELGGRS